MALTCSNQRVRRAALRAQADTPKAAFLTLVRHGARIQIAACTTTAATARAWAETVDRFAQTVADELVRRVDGDCDSATLVAGLTEASSVHLRELAALPRAAANHFDARITHASANNKEAR